MPSKTDSSSKPAYLGAMQVKGSPFFKYKQLHPCNLQYVSSAAKSHCFSFEEGESEKYSPAFFQARKGSGIHTFSLCPQTDSEWSSVIRISTAASELRLKIGCFIWNKGQALDFWKPGVYKFFCGTLPPLRYFMFASCQSLFGKHSLLTQRCNSIGIANYVHVWQAALKKKKKKCIPCQEIWILPKI